MAADSIDEKLRAVAEAFDSGGAFIDARPLGRGLIHETWAARFETPSGRRSLVIQRLNSGVFGDPAPLMDNIVRITEHLRAKLAAEAVDDLDRRCLRVVRTRSGRPFHLDPVGEAWRAFDRIEASVTCERLTGPAQAEEAARAFGAFARRLADLPAPPLHATLPRFHDFAARVAALEDAASLDSRGRARSVRLELEALRARAGEIQQQLDSAGFDRLPRRVVHHDCKLDNLLFDSAGSKALCVVDLDTVMPGNLLSDFGELVRSSTNTGSEDAREPERVDFDLEIYAALARGYREGIGPLLSPAEHRALPLAGPLLSLMNGMRFLTDHLAGDVYFRIARPEQNLARARAQLRLATRMLANEDALRAVFA